MGANQKSGSPSLRAARVDRSELSASGSALRRNDPVESKMVYALIILLVALIVFGVVVLFRRVMKRMAPRQ